MKTLRHKKEFEKVLANYRVSKDAINTLAKINFVGLVGVSSSGKDTIMKKLDETGKYHIVVSDTTRAPRTNNGVIERDGVEYWFKSEEEMLLNLQKGLLLEAEIIHKQQVSGIRVEELKRAEALNKIAINAVDPAGIANILAIKPDTIIILIIPPNFIQWLERLSKRGRMDLLEIQRRAATFPKVFQLLQKYPKSIHCVVNNELEQTVVNVEAIAEKRKTAFIYENPAIQKLVDDLLLEAKKYLKT